MIKKYTAHVFLLLSLILLCTTSTVNGFNQHSDTIFYIGDSEYPPFEFVNEDGKPDGFNIDLIRQLADYADREIMIDLMPWHVVVDSMRTGSKTYVTSMYISEQRELLYLFTNPHNKVSQAMFVPKGSDIKSLEDITDKTILVEEDDIMHEIVHDMRINGDVIKYENYTEALQALAEGKGDVVFCPLVQGNYYVRNSRIKGLTHRKLPFPPLDYCYSIARGDKDLQALLNEALLMARQDGTYEDIYKDWYAPYNDHGFMIFVKKWLLPAVIILLVLLSMVLVWIYSLKKQVLKKTSALKKELEHKKMTEKHLKEAKEAAEESDALKTAFLANLSHEIRTPMNGIMGFSDLIINDMEEDNPYREHVKIIHKSSVQLLNIIEDIINMSKIEVGQTEIHKSQFKLHEFLADVKELHDPLLKNKKAEFQLVLPEEKSDISIVTDRGKLKQILSNLINNAAKFTETGLISFGYTLKGGYIEFFVEDTGPGIPEIHQDKIFERFVQGKNRLNAPITGTGLGLSIARAYVEMLDGEIGVQSREGEGSRFYFTILPDSIHSKEETSEAETEQKKDKQKEQLKGKQILVAEDIVDNYYYIKELLKRYKITCHHARDGYEAVESIRKQDFDAVLMDLKMPVLNGYESFEEIRKLKPDLPIIALTAYAEDNDRQRVMEAGFDDYLAKPVSRDMIIKVLIEHIK